MKKTITYYSPGTFVSETTFREINGKNIEDIIVKATIESKNIIQRYNATPYSFRIEGISINYYLPHNKVELLSDIKNRKDPNDRILISNMENNDINAVMVSTVGWKSTQPFHEKDCLVNESGEIILKGFEADIRIIRERKLERILKSI